MLHPRSLIGLTLGLLVLLLLGAPLAHAQGSLELQPVEGPVEGWSTVELVGIYENSGNAPRFDVNLEGEILLDGQPFAQVADRGPVVEPGKAVQFTIPVELAEPGTYEARLWVVADGQPTSPSEVTFQAEGGTPPPVESGGFPWLWVLLGAGTLLAAGLAAFLVLKQKGKSGATRQKAGAKAKAGAKPAGGATAKGTPPARAKSAGKPAPGKKKPAANAAPAKAPATPKTAKPAPAGLLALLQRALPGKGSGRAKPQGATANPHRPGEQKANRASSPPSRGTPGRAAAKPAVEKTQPAAPSSGKIITGAAAEKPKPPAKEPGAYANQILKAFRDLNANIEDALPKAPVDETPREAAPREELDDRLDALLSQMRQRIPQGAPTPPDAHAAASPTAPRGTQVVPVGDPDPAPRTSGGRQVVRVKKAPAPPENPFTDAGAAHRIVAVQPKNPEPKAHDLGDGTQQVYRSREE